MTEPKKPEVGSITQEAIKLIDALEKWHNPLHTGCTSCNLCARVNALKAALSRQISKPVPAALRPVPETPAKHRPRDCGVPNENQECVGCGKKLGSIIPGHCYYLEGAAALKR